MKNALTVDLSCCRSDLSDRHDEHRSGSGSARKAFVNLTKMLVCLLVIVSLMLSMVVPVHAIALTTSIAIATVGALVLAACGLILTAPTGQSLTDYIGGQIDSYAVSQGFSNRSTWLNGVTQQTVTSTSIWSILDNAVKIPGGIYNALTTWAGSYIEDNNVVSNGQPVGQIGTSGLLDVGYLTIAFYNINTTSPLTPYDVSQSSNYVNMGYYTSGSNQGIVYSRPSNWSSSTSSTSPILVLDTSVVTNPVQYHNDSGAPTFFLLYSNTVPVNGQSWTFNSKQSISKDTNINLSTSYRYAVFVQGYTSNYRANQTYHNSVSGDISTPSGTVITPTASVVEPPVAGMGQDVIISGLPVTSSMTPEAAADAIQDQATTSAGLTATPSLDGEAVPEGSGWLYNAIQAVGEFIVDGIGGLFIPSEGFWDVYVDNISDLFDDRMGLLTYPISVVADLFERVADLDEAEPVIRWNDVIWKNQVVIPGGSYNLNDILEEDSMETIYGIYRVVVSGIMVIALIHLFIKKLEEIETK